MSTAGARSSAVEEELLGRADRRDVESAARVGDHDEQCHVVGEERSGEHDPLDVATRQSVDTSGRCAAIESRWAMRVVDVPAPHRRPVHAEAPPRERAAVEHEVLQHRQAGDDRVVDRVFGDARPRRRRARCSGRPRGRCPSPAMWISPVHRAAAAPSTASSSSRLAVARRRRRRRRSRRRAPSKVASRDRQCGHRSCGRDTPLTTSAGALPRGSSDRPGAAGRSCRPCARRARHRSGRAGPHRSAMTDRRAAP